MGKAQDLLSAKLDNLTKDTKDQFKAFGEGQEVLADKVDRIDERLEKVDERLIRVEDDVVEIKDKLSEKVDLEDFQKLEIKSL